jgi:hypothetical protein
MNDKPIQRILQALADEAVPPETDLWPALRARIGTTAARRGVQHLPKTVGVGLNIPAGAPAAGAKENPFKGTLTMTPTLFRQPRTRLLAISTLAALVTLAAWLLATPQGRVLAQNVWRFFNPAAADSFAVPEAMGAAEPSAGPTAVPPQFVAAACAADLACQLGAAEAAVGFEALALEDVPGLTWHYVEAFPESGTLRLGYTAQGGGGLVLSQSRGDLPASPWEAVPPEAAKAVQVNGQPAEYVEGTFVVMAGATEATWNAGAPLQRLRWREGGVLYELSKMGDPEPLEYLDEAALIALAESLQ